MTQLTSRRSHNAAQPRTRFVSRRSTLANADNVSAHIQKPFVIGFVGTLGALAAVAVGVGLGTISTIIVYIGAALFLALSLDPLVNWLGRKGLSRPLSIGAVFVAFAGIMVLLVTLIAPVIVRDFAEFVRGAPAQLRELENQEWFINVANALSGLDLDGMIDDLIKFISSPSTWLTLGGGLLNAGAGIVNGVVGFIVVLSLTLYFLSSLSTMKNATYQLVPYRSRERFIEITEEITGSIGGYVNGMVILAAINAALGFIAMLIIGVPYATILVVVIFLLALIPLIGSVLATIVVTIVALFASPATALAIAIYYLIYMQVESYVLTPRIMNKAISVPGSLVVIGALAGGSLLGMLGALVAIPVTASILLIIKKVVVPRQDRMR